MMEIHSIQNIKIKIKNINIMKSKHLVKINHKAKENMIIIMPRNLRKIIIKIQDAIKLKRKMNPEQIFIKCK